MTKLLLSTSNAMSGGPSVVRRTPFTKSNTEFTNSLRANFRKAWKSVDAARNGTNGSSTPLSPNSSIMRPRDHTRWTKQDGDMVWIPSPELTSEGGLSGERSQYDITVKLFFLPTTDRTLDEEHVSGAIGQVLRELGVQSIDLLIMSFPGVTFDADDDEDMEQEVGAEETTEQRAQMESMTRTWRSLEQLHSAGTVGQLGVAEFSSERLRRFLSKISVRPTLDQINVRDCCVVPKSLIVFGKQERIELLTHNDSTNILPKGTIRELLGDGETGAGVLCTEESREGCHEAALCGEVEPQWVVKYTAVVKDRGVVENKGYIAMANLTS